MGQGIAVPPLGTGTPRRAHRAGQARSRRACDRRERYRRRPSGRLRSLTLETTAGSETVPASLVRTALGLRSTWITVGVLRLDRPARGTVAFGSAAQSQRNRAWSRGTRGSHRRPTARPGRLSGALAPDTRGLISARGQAGERRRATGSRADGGVVARTARAGLAARSADAAHGARADRWCEGRYGRGSPGPPSQSSGRKGTTLDHPSARRPWTPPAAFGLELDAVVPPGSYRARGSRQRRDSRRGFRRYVQVTG